MVERMRFLLSDEGSRGAIYVTDFVLTPKGDGAPAFLLQRC